MQEQVPAHRSQAHQVQAHRSQAREHRSLAREHRGLEQEHRTLAPPAAAHTTSNGCRKKKVKADDEGVSTADSTEKGEGEGRRGRVDTRTNCVEEKKGH